MAKITAAGGLMPHQKDEHDIWICKNCGWKYPNAKPSPKIRNNHKKHCPGKVGTHAPGGSSDDVSDDDHRSSLTGSVAPKEMASDAPVLQMETKPRDFELAFLKGNVKWEAAPATAPLANGSANGASAQKEATTVNPGGFMPHQKDEHDIWICKQCGWKYPNARPSPQIRKNHKKHCPGKGGPVAAGGSSDDASDDEHHSHAPSVPEVAIESGREENVSTTTAPAEAPASISEQTDLAALKESPSPEMIDAIPTDISPDAGNGAEESSPPASEPGRFKNAIQIEIPPAAEQEKEDPAAAPEVPVRNARQRDFAARKKS